MSDETPFPSAAGDLDPLLAGYLVSDHDYLSATNATGSTYDDECVLCPEPFALHLNAQSDLACHGYAWMRMGLEDAADLDAITACAFQLGVWASQQDFDGQDRNNFRRGVREAAFRMFDGRLDVNGNTGEVNDA